MCVSFFSFFLYSSGHLTKLAESQFLLQRYTLNLSRGSGWGVLNVTCQVFKMSMSHVFVAKNIYIISDPVDSGEYQRHYNV